MSLRPAVSKEVLKRHAKEKGDRDSEGKREGERKIRCKKGKSDAERRSGTGENQREEEERPRGRGKTILKTVPWRHGGGEEEREEGFSERLQHKKDKMYKILS